CGTMSAWAVFSMLGFYPDCPGDPAYTLTSPAFDRAELKLPDGTLSITARRRSPDAVYIKEVTLDGKRLDSLRIPHDAIARGDHKLHFVLDKKPSARKK
ncbi:MAG: glycoside hydrolase family 92 protein, partial [Muribaculaceae bacterium]|nr:glycoside hydrolase family 92 protein [Muribaculaceae bacterium]